MPPKKDEKKKEDAPVDGMQSELLVLQNAKQDLELGQAMLLDKLQQCKAENEQLLQHITQLKSRIQSSTQDYADILQHRGEQIKAAEGRASGLQQQLEWVQQDLAQAAKEVLALKEANASQAARLDDAAALLADKDRLEETVKKQHALIEQRGQELKVLKAQLEGKEAAMEKAKYEMDELILKCQSSTQLRVLFGEPWLVQIAHVRLRGAVPYDREYNTLSCTAGGKQLLLYGGHSRLHESVGQQTAVLNLDSLSWEVPDSATQSTCLWGHSSCVVGRNKLLVFGGSHGEEATAAVQQLATDSMKWTCLSHSSAAGPQPRLCHAAAAVSDKVYFFGGMDLQGRLLDDLWAFELDSMHWSQLQTYGARPSARKGATLTATEDGRRLYLFGGNDGIRGPQNDCFCLDLEQLVWSPVQAAGTLPEPRESHMAGVLGRYLVISGGCGSSAAPAQAAGVSTLQLSSVSEPTVSGSGASAAKSSSTAADGSSAAAAAAAGNSAAGRRLADTVLLDMYSEPCWEVLYDGASLNAMWVKQMSVARVMHGNKLYTLQPNLHEQLLELQIITLTLPEEIECMKSAKKRDQEQVDKLEMLDSVAATSNSIDVSWQPPSKNQDRITGYKLMLSSSTGVVREVYQGKSTQYTCTGLKPAAVYVLSVKVTYDDGSILWSDSKAYRTKML